MQLNSQVLTPFEINDSVDTPLFDIDPDYQFFTDLKYATNISCDYYVEHTFCRLIQNKGNLLNQLSLFQLNVRSLPRHYNELDLYLHSLQYDFEIIGLTETWLTENNSDLYGIHDYQSINKFCDNRAGGGVSLYVKNSVNFEHRNDLGIFDNELEMLSIELDKSYYKTSRNVVILLIYRIPDTSIDSFIDKISNCLNSVIRKENKLCYILGDVNIDLMKHDSHTSTSDFLDLMYLYGMIPLIRKPTRITSHTATLIDHIFTNNFSDSVIHHQGILCSTLSDHYATFHIAESNSNDISNSEYMTERQYTEKNKNNLITFISQTNWDIITEQSDVQVAYSLFQSTLSELYNTSFPIIKVKKRYNNRKPWLSQGLKNCIKMKNRLHVKHKQQRDNFYFKNKYVKYRNKLNHSLRIAERKHYNNLLEEHKGNMKKSWKIIKSVINKNKN